MYQLVQLGVADGCADSADHISSDIVDRYCYKHQICLQLFRPDPRRPRGSGGCQGGAYEILGCVIRSQCGLGVEKDVVVACGEQIQVLILIVLGHSVDGIENCGQTGAPHAGIRLCVGHERDRKGNALVIGQSLNLPGVILEETVQLLADRFQKPDGVPVDDLPFSFFYAKVEHSIDNNSRQ